MNNSWDIYCRTNDGFSCSLSRVVSTSAAFCSWFCILSCVWFSSFLLTSMLLGPGLGPRDGAEPTEPSDRTGSVLDSESVLSKDSDGDMAGTGSLIWKTKGFLNYYLMS